MAGDRAHRHARPGMAERCSLDSPVNPVHRYGARRRAQGAPPAGYALFDPGNTGTPPGTSTSTILTLEVTMAWSDPSCTTLVPGTRSVMGMVTAKVRHVNPCVSGYGQGVG